MKISFASKSPYGTDLLLFAVNEGDHKKIKTGPYAKAIKAILDAEPDFEGAAGEVVSAIIPGAKIKQVGLLGLGKAKGRDRLAFEEVGGKLVSGMIARPTAETYVDMAFAKDISVDDVAAIGSGAHLRAYEFNTYKSEKPDEVLPDGVTFGLKDADKAQKAYKPMGDTAVAVHWARDLVNMPPNDLYPESFAKDVIKKLRPLGVKITVLDHKALEKGGYGAIMAVGKASERPPRLVILEYNGSKKKTAPFALVGKGVTFDTGGYSLKPGASMTSMKADMAGAAAVAGAMMVIAKTKAKCNVVAALGLAENMISDEGYRPDDVIKSLSGKTIEVKNTDAEGRLVLADAMWHIQKKYKPKKMVDIATLTGAALAALGQEYAGILTPDDAFCKVIDEIGAQTGDRVWRLPMGPEYDSQINSPIADMKNLGGRFAGASTAACFLGRFVQDGVTWAHIDMAPMMMNERERVLCPEGATGFGVRLLSSLAIKAG